MSSAPEGNPSDSSSERGEVRDIAEGEGRNRISHPAYAFMSIREITFACWPTSWKPDPERLYEAGFIYKGVGDRVVCFHCGLGLKDWKEEDDPWVQHAVWFPNCPFVREKKGQDFIDAAIREFRDAALANLEQYRILTSDPTEEPKKDLKSIEGGDKAVAPASLVTEESSLAGSFLLCKICSVEEVNAVFLPCSHLAACGKCAVSSTECVVCGNSVVALLGALMP